MPQLQPCSCSQYALNLSLQLYHSQWSPFVQQCTLNQLLWLTWHFTFTVIDTFPDFKYLLCNCQNASSWDNAKRVIISLTRQTSAFHFHGWSIKKRLLHGIFNLIHIELTVSRLHFMYSHAWNCFKSHCRNGQMQAAILIFHAQSWPTAQLTASYTNLCCKRIKRKQEWKVTVRLDLTWKSP